MTVASKISNHQRCSCVFSMSIAVLAGLIPRFSPLEIKQTWERDLFITRGLGNGSSKHSPLLLAGFLSTDAGRYRVADSERHAGNL